MVEARSARGGERSPVFALAFFVVPLLAWLFLGETLSMRQFVGAGLIMLGIVVATQVP